VSTTKTGCPNWLYFKERDSVLTGIVPPGYIAEECRRGSTTKGSSEPASNTYAKIAGWPHAGGSSAIAHSTRWLATALGSSISPACGQQMHCVIEEVMYYMSTQK
jgi:hypothetical protein